ncbi:putative Alba-like domain superfamily protein [Helianthus anomalus]
MLRFLTKKHSLIASSMSSVSITNLWEPIEEGLLPVEITRQVSMISITFSTKELNKNSLG